MSDQPGDWVRLLEPIGDPVLKAAGREGPLVWHLNLGRLPYWPGIVERRALYGKGSAALVDQEGRPWTAEVEIARRLTAGDWHAKWLLKYERPPDHFRPWVSMDTRADNVLPEEVTDILSRIGRSGAPDVLAWRLESEVLRIVGVEAKRRGSRRDRIGIKQTTWYRAALTEGLLARADLAIAEWTNDPELDGR